MGAARLILFSFAFGLLVFSSPRHVLAQANTAPVAVDYKVTYEQVNPSDGFGYLKKRLLEKFSLFFYSYSSQRKSDYYGALANKRLAELKYVIENNRMNDFERATTRYSTTVGMWVEYINKKGLNNGKGLVAQLLSQHIPVVQNLMEKYDPTTAEWRFVKHDVDYLNIYISQLE